MYTPAFERAVDHAMKYEVGAFWNQNAPGVADGTGLKACGYVNDPADAGGETKFGISKRANPTVNIRSLTWAGAKDIYYHSYWIPGKCDRLSAPIALIHFDGCVNHGVGTAAKHLQAALGVTADGDIGPKTLTAARTADYTHVCNSIADQRVEFYKRIVARNPSQSRFIKGWLRRISELRAYSTDRVNFI